MCIASGLYCFDPPSPNVMVIQVGVTIGMMLIFLALVVLFIKPRFIRLRLRYEKKHHADLTRREEVRDILNAQINWFGLTLGVIGLVVLLGLPSGITLVILLAFRTYP